MKQVAKTVKKALNEAEYLDNDEELLDEYRDEWDYVMKCIFAELRTDNRHNKSAIGVDDDTLLAYYYEETPIDYEFLCSVCLFLKKSLSFILNPYFFTFSFLDQE